MSTHKSYYLGPWIEVRKKGKKKALYFDEVLEEDVLFELDAADDVFRLAPNVRRAGDPNRDIDGDDAFALELSSVSPNQEKTWLETAFANELSALRAAFGEKNVMLGWGLVMRWR